MQDELFTIDLDISSVQGRTQLAALLRTVHLRADRPSLRTLEARTRHSGTPLSKTVVSEMLKGTRFPRKAVMIAFLHTCGVSAEMMEPWLRAWERVAASEHNLAPFSAEQNQIPNGVVPAPRPGELLRADEPDMPTTENEHDLITRSPERVLESADPASQEGPGRTASGPLISRRELGILMRGLRTGTRMTIEQVASRLECSPSKVSRIETGFRSVSLRDVRDLCDIYSVSGTQRDYLLELAREGRQRGWWQSYDLPFAAYIGLEAGATSIADYHATVVPGLLQTADYARAIEANAMSMQGPTPMRDLKLIEQAIDVRLKRQRLLIQHNPPRLHVVVDEAVLRRIVGSPEIMRAQLESIIEKAAFPNISVQVIPYESGAYSAMDSSFTILDLPRPTSSIVYVEGLFGFIYLERSTEIERFKRVFLEVQAVAAGEQESAALIIDAISDLNRRI